MDKFRPCLLYKIWYTNIKLSYSTIVIVQNILTRWPVRFYLRSCDMQLFLIRHVCINLTYIVCYFKIKVQSFKCALNRGIIVAKHSDLLLSISLCGVIQSGIYQTVLRCTLCQVAKRTNWAFETSMDLFATVNCDIYNRTN